MAIFICTSVRLWWERQVLPQKELTSKNSFSGAPERAHCEQRSDKVKGFVVKGKKQINSFAIYR
jgi:hypothetical protein